MAFKNMLLPELISFGAQGGPDWSPSSISPLESGDEAREVVKSLALGKWTIAYQARLREHWDAFQDFIYIAGGVRDSWRFHDVLDDSCLASQAHLEAIDSTNWQMCKRRTVNEYRAGGTYTYDQPIILPVTYSITGTGAYTVDRETGIVTKTGGADPSGFTCTLFHKLCRFDIDQLLQTVDTRDASGADFIVSYAGITVLEIPLTSA